MNNLRTPEAIAAEIAALQAMKPNVRRYTLFHDDNHAAIDAQIQLLQESDPEEAINDYSIENDEHIYFAVSEALEWLRGERDEPPSVDWADLTTDKR